MKLSAWLKASMKLWKCEAMSYEVSKLKRCGAMKLYNIGSYQLVKLYEAVKQYEAVKLYETVCETTQGHKLRCMHEAGAIFLGSYKTTILNYII